MTGILWIGWWIILFAFEGDGVIKDFPGNYTQIQGNGKRKS